MAKREYQRRTRARRFGQLMLLSSALMNTQLCLAELSDAENSDKNSDKTAAAELDQRALLLYLAEFDPELDPVELSQMDAALSGEQEKKTDAKTAAEASADAVVDPKN